MINHHQKVIISSQKCALIPHNRSFNHIFLTFSLKKLFTHFCRKMSRVAFTRFFGPNSPCCQDQGGYGMGQTNFGNAKIQGPFEPQSPPLGGVGKRGGLCGACCKRSPPPLKASVRGRSHPQQPGCFLKLSTILEIFEFLI